MVRRKLRQFSQCLTVNVTHSSFILNFPKTFKAFSELIPALINITSYRILISRNIL